MDILKNISVIFWDFDGVILNSMKIKAKGFKKLFENYDETLVNQLEEYHYKNGGVSRFEKIKYFYNHLLGKNISDEEINNLAKEFSQIIKGELYNKENLIEDSVSFIRNHYRDFDFHIISGAEHHELNDLCKFFEIDKYFISINGSPPSKEKLMQEIIKKYNYQKEKIIMIGDSINDYTASRNNGIEFFGYNNPELKKIGNYIESFKKGIFLHEKIR